MGPWLVSEDAGADPCSVVPRGAREPGLPGKRFFVGPRDASTRVPCTCQGSNVTNAQAAEEDPRPDRFVLKEPPDQTHTPSEVCPKNQLTTQHRPSD